MIKTQENANQPPSLGGELIPRYDVHWNDQLVVQYPDGDFCKWEDVFKLQAEIDRRDSKLETMRRKNNELNEDVAKLKARCDELEALLLEVRKKPGFFSGEFVLRIDAALSKPAGSEQV